MIQVTIVPFKGSLFSFFCLANQKSILLEGKILSFASACKVLGAIIIDPKADEIAAHASPIGIIGPQIAISLITS